MSKFDPENLPMLARKFNPHEDLGVRFIMLGPFEDDMGWGTSPYLDWFLETLYIHCRAWHQ